VLDTLKLRHVLLWAIRKMLTEHGVAFESIRTQSRSNLISLVTVTQGVTQAEIDQLYEEYSYGTRPTFYVYLSPPSVACIWNGQHLGPELSRRREKAQQDGASLGERSLQHEGDDSFGTPHQFHEVSLSYLHEYAYIDSDDNPDSIEERRHAYLWVNCEQGLVAIIARDSSICKPLIAALAEIAKTQPLVPQMSRKSLERIVKRDSASRVRFLDKDGVGRSMTGLNRLTGIARVTALQEVQRRIISGDQDRGGLYPEVIGSRLGSMAINAANGSLSLTLHVGLSDLRAWGETRLVEIVRAIRADQAIVTKVPASSLSMKGVPKPLKFATHAILEAVVQARTLDRPVPLPGALVGDAFPGRLTAHLAGNCPSCDVEGYLDCDGCNQEAQLQSARGEPICIHCGATPQPRCAAGHRVPLKDQSVGVTLEPDDALRREWIQRLRNQGGLDPESGYIVFWRDTVWAANSANPSSSITWIQNMGDTYSDISVSGSKNIAIGSNASATNTEGMAGADLVQLFDRIYEQIQRRPDDESVDKDELIGTVQKIQTEAAKGDAANEGKLSRWFRFLAEAAPDVLEVATACLVNPVAGVATAVSKIASKARDGTLG
jgi:hypothetical protein